ncbi:ribosome small subunit-dependent GTPase A [Mycoplasma sp. NEAQ87857]|uniref:ribosome small subunit-dependent GTPase A n=1 Tax=Mycoplasma sp. NEAQ87857 TaxID=2683967 RepID=UPI0013185FC2|nr:ribosome small subunit-dependent GTPase A [Mycoplasma sp. NEAQ87857]QGZ97478.1 ribosome small subunit-dependent GTPase A [Mycoplasma sp. NEAQ87857]
MHKIHKIIANRYTVCDQDYNCQVLSAAGKLRLLDITPVVGDNVEINEHQIIEIKERKNWFIRPKVANIDQMLVFMSVKEPKFQQFLLDKYLAIIEYENIEPIICLTKVDLAWDLALELQNQYQKMGYKVFLINNTTKELSNLKSIFKDKYSVFMGQSGVGKTTTLNSLSNNNFDTQAISKSLGRGKHTTRVVEIVPFNNGYLIDTPGFSSLAIPIDALELAHSFNTFKQLLVNCKYRSCLHLNENEVDCAIKQAVTSNLIPQFRYDNYVKLQKELTERKF